jgi:hypothetical protein
MLGFKISERTVLRWMRNAPKPPEPTKRWIAFLNNHCEIICRNGLLHGTRYPTSAWVSQQLREAFPFDNAPKYLIFDRTATFGEEAINTIRTFGIEPKRTSFRSPWRNGMAERFVGSCRRNLLDHVFVLNERHLKRLMAEYIRYYHDNRTHLGLGKNSCRSDRYQRGSCVRWTSTTFIACVFTITRALPLNRKPTQSLPTPCRSPHSLCGWNFGEPQRSIPRRSDVCLSRMLDGHVWSAQTANIRRILLLRHPLLFIAARLKLLANRHPKTR